MSDRENLHLHEQLMLLALRDEKGTLESKASMYSFALGGALLAELSLRRPDPDRRGQALGRPRRPGNARRAGAR